MNRNPIFLPNSVAKPEKMAGLTPLACYFLYLRRPLAIALATASLSAEALAKADSNFQKTQNQ
jgi:hypothetical protein